jgi:hypothetical protein
VLEIRWDGQKQRFVVELKATWTPKSVAAAASRAVECAAPPELLPMVIVPFLSRERLLELERKEVSAVDLCGNGVVVVPHKLLVSRSGQPNRFRDSRPLRNVYRGTASLVADASTAHQLQASRDTETQD